MNEQKGALTVDNGTQQAGDGEKRLVLTERDLQDCIVVRSKCCGRVVMTAVNLPDVVDAEFQREIGEAVIAGCTVEHMPAHEVRKQNFVCKCGEQSALPIPQADDDERY